MSNSNIKQAIAKLIDHHDLTIEEMRTAVKIIMSDQATAAQIAGFLIALRMKGETVDEITAAAQVMRELCQPVAIHDPNLIDIVGTGGDQANTFNISTTSAIVAAAAGCKVAKHGNRSLSSQSGSADLLSAAGVELDLTPAQIIQCIDKIGIGFMFAPHHHPAMRYAGAPRKELGVRTLFNLLGPLTNPANVKQQIFGVYDKKWLLPMAKVMQQLDCKHVMVIHSQDGLDEISIADKTFITELKQSKIKQYEVTPEQFNLPRAKLNDIKVNSPQESLKRMQNVLDNTPGGTRDIVILNAGAAIYVAGMTETLNEGIQCAAQTIASGAAKEKLQQFITLTKDLKNHAN
ncbi:MAG: anthranilate phosphoribosyltransferase [Gammaproteobacteria bacterium]